MSIINREALAPRWRTGLLKFLLFNMAQWFAKVSAFIVVVVLLTYSALGLFNWATTRSVPGFLQGMGPAHYHNFYGGITSTKPNERLLINLKISTTAVVEDPIEKSCSVVTRNSRYVSVFVRTTNGASYVETRSSSLEQFYRDIQTDSRTLYLTIRLPPAECALFNLY